ncbi:hypothetical protein FGE12_03205 [Aggregicoccus sp. 17bor-14]|uniref:Ig-like domain-containing protein n=1 Tax=Myxococcaceae TaxID=31 RepID=UPI00129C2229|nr:MULTISPECIES: Ig-like domain-containing protein [Myxococcaceae]MBF5041381.1 Ig-like domain-containing protein [Simulacricoccus sp. 17bor-14]MRI87165.1 hypothetical protein [Aggregicoccus sp. 17bor-14]
MPRGLAVCVALSCSLLGCSQGDPASLEFVDLAPAQPRLGETVTVRFRAVDERGEPQQGTPVTFSLQGEPPGVELGDTEVRTTVGDGLAITTLKATGRVASAVVVAKAGNTQALSQPISFAGAEASSRQLTFQCGPVAGAASGGRHAIGAYDSTRSLIAGVKLECTAHLGDRNGDGVPGVQVSFLTEAGTIGPSSTSLTDVVGNAAVLYKTSLPLPVDVEPATFSWTPPVDATHTGELVAPLWMHPFEWMQNPVAGYGTAATLEEPRRPDPILPGRVNNPRDNLVTLIAITTGEEAFEDRNNNGTWDTGEPFVDLTEPFVDANDSGTWEPGERFVDANGNGTWDGKNGRYDASTLIWAQERILWTGWPDDRDRDPANTPTVRQVSPAAGAIALGHFGRQKVVILIDDPWFNPPAQNGEGDGCASTDSVVRVTSETLFGMRFTYAPAAPLVYRVEDVHDPASNPQPAPFPSAVAWETTPRCSFTASDKDGHVVSVFAPRVFGTVL